MTELLESGLEETNERTGSRIKVLPGGVSLKVDLRSGHLPTCGHRKLFPKTAAAEVAWFASGKQDVTWLKKYAPIWDKFVEDDGKTIDAAYGYRWRMFFARDQLEMAVKALRNNPSDRRVYISAWDPARDGLGMVGQKNVPCPVGFTLSIVAGQLHSSLLLRSSDVFVGLPYDIMGHAILMQVLLDSINGQDGHYELGSMHFTLAHPHLYEAHYDMARHAVEQVTIFESPKLVRGWQLCDVEVDPDQFVAEYAEEATKVKWPGFCPRPEVIV